MQKSIEEYASGAYQVPIGVVAVGSVEFCFFPFSLSLFSRERRCLLGDTSDL